MAAMLGLGLTAAYCDRNIAILTDVIIVIITHRLMARRVHQPEMLVFCITATSVPAIQKKQQHKLRAIFRIALIAKFTILPSAIILFD